MVARLTPMATTTTITVQGSATDDYETADTESFTVDGVDFLKALTATSAGHTPGTDVTLGEIVTYVLTATVPEGNIPSLTIVDNLPPGLAYVPGTASYDDSSFSNTLPVPVITSVGGSGDDVTWSFGTFSVDANNDPTDNSFTLTLQAVVMDVPGNVGIPPQTVLTNVATVQVGSDTPESSNPVDVTVVEPQLTITKDFDKTQVTPNESTIVTLVVENTGTSTAFDMVIEDPLANNTFTNITEGTTPAGWTFSTVPSGGDTIVRYELAAGTPFPVGALATFTFSVTMHPDLAPSPPNVNNVATVTDASTLDSTVNDGDEDNATNVDEEREYTTDDNDDLVIIVPDLVLTKTNGVIYVSPGDVVIYDINVENVGGADATGVVITETVPANTTFNLANSTATWASCADGAAAGTTCVLTVGPLASGANTTVQFAVNIDNPLPLNTATITNAAVTGDDNTKGNDPTPPNNTDDHTDTVTAAIGDYVWEDLDADGTQNDGNTGMNGVTVYLYQDVDGDGIPEPGGDDGAPVATTVTADDGGGNPGYYIFDRLIPGDYFVEFDAPAGYAESPQDQGADDADSDADIITGVAAVTTLDPGERDMTWDAGFYQPVSLGNRVWLDANADGTQDAGEIDIPGVELRLFQADGTTRAVDVDGFTVADETTDVNGYYNFGNLPPGDYIVEVRDTNWNAGNVFGTGGAFAGTLGSPGTGADNQDNTDDNGNNDGVAALSTGVRSGLINLTINGEPTSEDPQETVANNDSDLTIDFGFYQPVSIGNRVWLDENGNGIQDGGELDIENVEVALFEGDGTTQASHVDGTPVVNVTTDVNGYYNFGNLPPGDYVVEVIADNWLAGNVFGTGGLYEGAVGSPGSGADNQDNTDDNGNNDGTTAIGAGVQSSAITLASQMEPTLEDAQETVANDNSDLTVDFGFYQPVSIGNRVWFDINRDGVQNAVEIGIPGVDLRLFESDGVTQADNVDGFTVIDVTTDGSGYYNFGNLPPGDYIVEVLASNWDPGAVFGTGGAYEGALGSPGVGADDQNNTDDNGNNNDTAVLGTGARSGLINLISNDEPTSEDVQEATPDNDSDLTVDFGFYQPVSLGNRVWFDENANGLQDGGEPDIENVEVALFLGDGTTQAFHVDGSPVVPVMTDANGYYNFGNLPPGDYVVEVTAVNWNAGNVFGTGGTYEGALGSPGAGADNQNNNDDNGDNDGTAALGTGVQSSVIILASQDEPASEDIQEVIPDNNSDLTIDFGFYQPVSLGNRVWLDANADGVQDAGEIDIPGVELRLFEADGTTRAVDVDGVTVVDETTDVNGYYNFGNLAPGTYVVDVRALNWNAGNVFGTGGAFAGALGSPGFGLDNQDNTDDNGNNDGVASLGTGVQSRVITLTIGGEPTLEDAQETVANDNSDLTIDFGFYQPLSLGNRVWLDENGNGIQDGGEADIENVELALFEGDGTTIASHVDGSPVLNVTTDVNGYYNFGNLPPGDYIVEVISDNWLAGNVFGTGGTYEGAVGSPGSGADNQDNTDDNGDNDGTAVIGVGARSSAITLAAQTEPTLEDAQETVADNNSDLTIDFGFYQPVSIGNRVWFDINGDGVQDAGENGIAGVDIELYQSPAMTPAVDVDGNAVGMITTNPSGYYDFSNLPPGDYVVEMIGANWNAGNIFGTGGTYEGAVGSPGFGLDNQDNSDDNGNNDGTAAFAGVQSREITLVSNGEPTLEDSQEPIADNNSDLTIDFGVYQPVSIGNRVWFDIDADGIQDAGEIGIENVEVALFLADGTTQASDVDGNPVANDTTDASGYYNFANLPPGGYVVAVVSNNWAGANIFGPTGAYANALGSPGLGADNQDNSDDNGDNDGTAAAAGVQSSVITLLSNGEPSLEDSQETIADNNSDLTIDFGFYLPVSLGNRVWLDTNADGIQDAGEIGIENVEVALFAADGVSSVTDMNGTTVANIFTDPSGYYNFGNLHPDDYIVEIVSANWNAGNVFGTGGTYEDALGSPGVGADNQDNTDDNGNNDGTAASAGVRSTVIELRSAQEPVNEDVQELVPNNNSDLTIDFGFYQLASIGDYVWLDADQDGLQDSDEFGIPNVTVTLYDSGGSVISTTVTDAYGFYNFVELTPDPYYIGITVPAGYIITTQDANGNADDTVDSDIDPMGFTVLTTLDSNEYDPTWDAGLYIDPASIGDYVWLDQNQDGIQDGVEFGILGVTVNLYDSNNNLIDTTLTDDFGHYLFDNLVPGDYYIEVIPLPGYNVSLQDVGDDALDSDIDATVGPTYGQTIVTTLDPNEHDPTWDAGLYNDSAAIGDLVWHDIDADGIQDPGEPGIENVTVVLYDVNNTAIHTTTTDVNGNYIFQFLPPGDYYVDVIPPVGYDISPQDEPGAPDANSDSDIDPATGETVMTTLDPAETDLTWDAGLYIVASLGDYVWEDSNGDGLQDETGTGLNGVTVNLYVDVDGDGVAEPGTDDGAAIASTVTANDGGGNAGYYLFDNLVPGYYFVEFVIPAGYIVSPQDQGADDSLDSDADVSNGLTIVTDLISDEHDPTWDVGLYHPVSLGNWVWLDTNANGTQDGGEIGIENVELALYLSDGTTQALHTDGSPVANEFTDASGYYNFGNLPPGDYIVEIVSANWNAGNVFGTGGTYEDAAGSPGSGTDNQDNSDDNGNNDGIINPAGGVQSSVITLTSSGEPELEDGQETVADNDSDLTIDFGFYQYASLGDYVWVDSDVDGTQNEVGTGYNGVTVNLYVDVDGDGVAEPNGDDGTPVAITVTADDGGGNPGYYLFDNLVPDDYFVEFVMPTDYIPTLPDLGGDDALDSDAEQATGLTPVTTLDSGEHDPTIDTGIFLPSSIGDYVWDDINRDGIQDASEVGIDGVTVHLYDATNTIIMTTTTASGGAYLFDNLVPGDYHIGFVPPTGYAVSPQDANGNVDDNVDSDADMTNGETVVTTLVWDEHDPTWDAGIYMTNPEITIDKSVSIARIAPNQTSVVTYTLLITNTGNMTMYNVTITDTLPNLVTYNNVSLPIVPVVNGQELVWSDITAGAPFNPGDTFQIDFEAAVPVDIGTYTNVAEVIGFVPPGFDYPGGSVGDDDDAVLVIEDPTVALDKSIVAPGIVDGYITYTIQITNTGPSVIDVLPVVDSFSGPMEYVGGTPTADVIDNVTQALAWNDITDTFGDLAPGQVVTIETVFRLTTIDTEVTLTNQAQVLGAQDEHDNPTNEPEDQVDLINVPTAVDLVSFTVVGNEGGTVDIEWVTAYETNNYGFDLRRSATNDFATSDSIYFETSVVGTGIGKTYQYQDNIPNDGVWYYWLVDIDNDGLETVHGPKVVNSADISSGLTHFIFLPVVIR